jgi:hypothetical protein
MREHLNDAIEDRHFHRVLQRSRGIVMQFQASEIEMPADARDQRFERVEMRDVELPIAFLSRRVAANSRRVVTLLARDEIS